MSNTSNASVFLQEDEQEYVQDAPQQSAVEAPRKRRAAAVAARKTLSDALGSMSDEELKDNDGEHEPEEAVSDDFDPETRKRTKGKEKAKKGTEKQKIRVGHALPWRGVSKEASINHFPLDLMDRICRLLSIQQLMLLKNTCLYMHRCATNELARRALDMFGVADYRATIGYQLWEKVEINMGIMKTSFGMSTTEARSIRHRSSVRGGYYAYTVYIYDRRDAITAALKKYGSIHALLTRRSNRKPKKAKVVQDSDE